MVAGTPVSKLIEAVAEVERIQRQIAGMTETVNQLTRRVDALEQRWAEQAGKTP